MICYTATKTCNNVKLVNIFPQINIQILSPRDPFCLFLFVCLLHLWGKSLFTYFSFVWYRSECPKHLNSRGGWSSKDIPLDYSDCFRDAYVTQALPVKVCSGDFSGTSKKDCLVTQTASLEGRVLSSTDRGHFCLSQKRAAPKSVLMIWRPWNPAVTLVSFTPGLPMSWASEFPCLRQAAE